MEWIITQVIVICIISLLLAVFFLSYIDKGDK